MFGVQETTIRLSQSSTDPVATIRTSDRQLFCCKSIDKLISESEAPGQRLQKNRKTSRPPHLRTSKENGD